MFFTPIQTVGHFIVFQWKDKAHNQAYPDCLQTAPFDTPDGYSGSGASISSPRSSDFRLRSSVARFPPFLERI